MDYIYAEIWTELSSNICKLHTKYCPATQMEQSLHHIVLAVSSIAANSINNQRTSGCSHIQSWLDVSFCMECTKKWPVSLDRLARWPVDTFTYPVLYLRVCTVYLLRRYEVAMGPTRKPNCACVTWPSRVILTDWITWAYIWGYWLRFYLLRSFPATRCNLNYISHLLWIIRFVARYYCEILN